MTRTHRRDSENALLFAAASAAPPPLDRSGTLDGLDWDYVLAAANRQGITPLLAHWLREASCAIPPAIAEHITAAYWTSHFRNRALLRELHRILAGAAEAGIRVMPLKGAALVAWYYPVPALRPMSDLDLLVRPEDVTVMAALLGTLGYSAIPRAPSFFDERGAESEPRERAFLTDAAGMRALVEFRTEPLDPGIGPLLKADPASAAQFHVHCVRMWERGRPATIGGAPCVRIAPEDMMLHVASHLTTRHAGLRLLWLHDLCLIAAQHRDSFDWGEMIADAHRLQVIVPIHAALTAARRWLDAPLGREPFERLSSAIPHRSFRRSTERRIFSMEVAALGRSDLAAPEPPLPWRPLALSMLRARHAPWRAVGRIIAPSRAYMTWWYGEALKSRRAYRCAVTSRIAYVGLNIGYAVAIRLNARPFAYRIDHLIRRMRPHTLYDDHADQ